MSDSYVQIAPDNTGKQVDMDLVTTGVGATLYRQKAVMVGITSEQLDELLSLSRQMLAVSRAILASINATTSAIVEDDFTLSSQSNP